MYCKYIQNKVIMIINNQQINALILQLNFFDSNLNNKMNFEVDLIVLIFKKYITDIPKFFIEIRMLIIFHNKM